jgi:alkylation response protein AidB-like acyl-CoA dehydrogenase
VRKWFTEHPQPSPRELVDAGFVVPHWPRPYGLDAEPELQLIIEDEMRRAGVAKPTNPIGIGHCGPILVALGSEEQKERYIWPMLTAEEMWCQLFSEPGAGSDLAALSTRAEKRGNTYVVNGQKVWSSYATFASWGIALVRTDPDAPNHKGISMLAVAMDAPGVEIRPLQQMTREHEFNEVFFDDVEVPVDHVIGPEHEGWRVANTTLANERGASFIWREQVLHQLAIARLIDTCDLSDPVTRDAIARSWIEIEIFRLHNARTLARIARGEELGAESSVVKLFWANLSQRFYENATTAAGPKAMLEDEWGFGMLTSRATSIMGGTSEIQRNIIGERLLGLPREPKA